MAIVLDSLIVDFELQVIPALVRIDRMDLSGIAWLLWSKSPTITVRQAINRSWRIDKRQNGLDCKVSVQVGLPQDIASTPPTDSDDSRIDAIYRELGEPLAETLANGFNQVEASQLLGLSESMVSRRIKNCREIVARI